jgi:hypothetical protein
VHIRTNIHDPPAEGNFCDESGNLAWPQPLWSITINTWVTSIKVAEWSTATLSVDVHGSRWRNCFFMSLTSQFQTATFCKVLWFWTFIWRLLTDTCGKYGKACWSAHQLHPVSTHAYTKKRHQVQAKFKSCNVGLCRLLCFKDVSHQGTGLGGNL